MGILERGEKKMKIFNFDHKEHPGQTGCVNDYVFHECMTLHFHRLVSHFPTRLFSYIEAKMKVS